jgi:hypothetical protein
MMVQIKTPQNTIEPKGHLEGSPCLSFVLLLASFLIGKGNVRFWSIGILGSRLLTRKNSPLKEDFLTQGYFKALVARQILYWNKFQCGLKLPSQMEME